MMQIARPRRRPSGSLDIDVLLRQIVRPRDVPHEQTDPVAAGAKPREPYQTDRPASSGLGPLTPRQTETLRLFLLGASEKQAALQLGVSRHTVHEHVKAIYRTLDVSSRSELMA